MKITDGKMTVKISMHTFDESTGSLSPDWSADFFDAGLLPYDEETETHSVPDCDYCIDQAMDWKAEAENNLVFVEEL